MKTKHHQFAAYMFSSLNDAKFSLVDYSCLKHGCLEAAQRFGFELADKFFDKHSDILLANNVVVIPSPYNYVKNAATIMTEFFIKRLNHHLVSNSGTQVEYSMIHRKVSYINDYGFLSKEKRKGLIDNDSFYLVKEFYKNKLLIFVDDVLITGTHEQKLKEILQKDAVNNTCMFVYFAKYTGIQASIESEINLFYVKDIDTYVDVVTKSTNATIVRTIKYLLGLNISQKTMMTLLKQIPDTKIQEIYYGALGEGYFKIPKYQNNFQLLMKYATRV